MQFLANENIPLPSVRLLRKAGYDTASVTEISPGIDDTTVLTRAVDEQPAKINSERFCAISAICQFIDNCKILLL